MTYRRVAVAITTTIIALLAPLIVSAAANAADEIMTEKQAGTYYLTHLCRHNDAGDRFDSKLWGNRENVPYAEVRRRLSQFRYEASRYSSAGQKFATKLLNPPALWPEEVAHKVDRYAALILKYSAHLNRASNAGSARGWGYWWLKARALPTRERSAEIRAYLNLPPPGEGC